MTTKRTALCSSVRVPEEIPGSLRTPERSSINSLFGVRLHSVPCSTRVQGRKGQSEISNSNSPRAPNTAGFEQCTPRLLRRPKSSPTVQRRDSAPERQAKIAVLRSALRAWAPMSSSKASRSSFESVTALCTSNLSNSQSKKMQLYDQVTSSKNTPHNRDYVDCSPNPENGICAKIEGDPARGPCATPSDQKRFPRSMVTSGNACKAIVSLEWVSSE